MTPQQRKAIYESAKAHVIATNRVNASAIQRACRINLYEANDMIAQMEREGIVSAESPTGKRKVISA